MNNYIFQKNYQSYEYDLLGCLCPTYAKLTGFIFFRTVNQRQMRVWHLGGCGILTNAEYYTENTIRVFAQWHWSR
ncbi:MAG: hypothetical protein OXI43_16910 [Candidatus Poribacteria bacterium]|nr:hypothetical protein [Candidatus Poribacteria bacterium]